MAFFSKRELMRLLEVAKSPCISLYMPSHRFGAETQQDAIRLKNLLSQAEIKLNENTNLSEPEIKTLLSSARKLIDNYNFWQHQEEGLAIFLTEDHSLIYRLPYSFKEELVVSEQFYIRPLLPILSGQGEYYILAMSQNDVQLFSASRDHIHRLDVEGLTKSLEEALNLDEPKSKQQIHQSHSTIYHGQGAGHDHKKENILRFCQKVDSDLQTQLRNTSAPLVFVGVDYLFPIYQKANSYAHLHDQFIAMNPDQIHEAELHKVTWPLVKSIFEQPIQEAVNDFRDRYHTSDTTSNLLEVLSAAHDGQVETLLVANDSKIFGKFDAKQRQVNLDSEPQGDHDELFNLAAIYTLFCDGTVYSVDREMLPQQSTIGAVLRYPMTAHSSTSHSKRIS